MWYFGDNFFMKFFETTHCTSKVHCAVCRNPDAVQWRVSLSKAFDVGLNVNFDCPHGVPWSGLSPNAIVRSVSNKVNIHRVYRLRQPGDFVAWALSKWFKYHPPTCSSCMKMRGEMNAVGWIKSVIRLPSYLPKMFSNYRNILKAQRDCTSRRNK